MREPKEIFINGNTLECKDGVMCNDKRFYFAR